MDGDDGDCVWKQVSQGLTGDLMVNVMVVVMMMMITMMVMMMMTSTTLGIRSTLSCLF